ncbi:hypothetical protein SAMN05192539_1015113 [Paraburkholderia diazotrophica]|uniref:Uncharacterized protein n=1 Tax=Paraburkholderia diazotrophica TaxID=667676 RepID=A0A1H7AQC6_9BURK|nr:hypothetical protein SAMN05192539_1015113 [Paraburkholderia diazotrophica]
MKTTFLVPAVVVGAFSLAGVAQAQDTSPQQDAQSSSTTTSASASSSASRDSSGYGGVSGSNGASGNLTRWGQGTCGHLPQCNADSGH